MISRSRFEALAKSRQCAFHGFLRQIRQIYANNNSGMIGKVWLISISISIWIYIFIINNNASIQYIAEVSDEKVVYSPWG